VQVSFEVYSSRETYSWSSVLSARAVGSSLLSTLYNSLKKSTVEGPMKDPV